MDPERERELEAIRDDLRLRFPPRAILDELGAGGKPSDLALGAAILLVDDIAPALLEAIERAAAGAELDEQERALAFYGLHVLGAARDARAFPALMRILRLPPERLDNLLGDGLTQTIPRVIAGCFDDRAEELYALIADPAADEYARLEAFGAVAFLAFAGRIAIADAKRFLVRFDAERMAPPQDMAWAGWENAIALLGFRDLVPLVEAAWKDGRTPQDYSEPEYFFADLKRAETAWSDDSRFKDEHHYGYIEDIADALSWIAGPDDATPDLHTKAYFKPGVPHVNPLRDVGRNDPCPCGSGKKAKRCCLAG